MEAKADRREIKEAEARTGEEMTEEALEGATRRREEAEARLGVATNTPERLAKEAERREVKEAQRRAEEGERL